MAYFSVDYEQSGLEHYLLKFLYYYLYLQISILLWDCEWKDGEARVWEHVTVLK